MRSIQKQVACSLFSCLFHSLRDSSLPRAAPSLQLNQPPFFPPSHPPKSSFSSSVRPSSNSRNRPFSFSSDSELSSSEDERPDTFKWNPFADTKRNRKERPTLESRTQSRSARNRSAAAARADYDATADTTDPSHRWSRIQVGKGKLLGKKPKKRPPPGPRQFEDLTAKTPMHSDLPFDFRFSYTETYKATPVRFQEPFSPFGPGRLDREWTGLAAVRTPVSASVNPDASAQDSQQKTSEDKADLKGQEGKTKLSSSHPSARKKGVKPGPSLRGKAPKRAKTREEILGEPLTKEEVKELVEHCNKSDKQVNLGRDGLTHNMLILIHNNWKREHAVRIKCKGVPTVDMENICFHLEDKTGGKIIHRAGGAVYLFRGRNYTKKDRPEIPLMLWKPHSPIYPKLIQAVPDGLTLNEANAKRKRGLKIMPLCKLAKNGYYADLVKHVKEAFEDDELVRIDCKGLNTSDYKKIGAKLRDLVPCVLLSFEREQIIIWRGREYHESMKPKETGVVEDATSDGHALKEAGLSPEVDGFKNDAEITAVSSSSVVLDEHDQSGGVFNVEEEELLLSDSDCDADALDEGDASSKSWESDFNIDDGEGDSSDESLPDEGEEMSYSLPSDYAGKSDAASTSLQ